MQSIRKFIIPAVLMGVVGLIAVVYVANPPQTKQEQLAEGMWLQEGNLYRTTLNYSSPGGEELNNVAITVNGDTVTGVEFEVASEIAASIRYQEQFASQIPGILVGRRLQDLEAIDKLSGATLTTDAFNQAIEQLQRQLQS